MAMVAHSCPRAPHHHNQCQNISVVLRNVENKNGEEKMIKFENYCVAIDHAATCDPELGIVGIDLSQKNSAVANFVADVIAAHCVHCPNIWNRSCKQPCVKVLNEFPKVLQSEYVAEWARTTSIIVALYAKPIASND